MVLETKTLRMIGELDPTAVQITNLFIGLSKIDPKILKVILASIDEALLRKIANWAQAFAESMNRVTQQKHSPQGPGLSTDFDTVMSNTKWKGEKLTPELLDEVSNRITKAIKSENWTRAINVTMSLLRVVG